MITVFFAKLIAGVILGIGTGVVLGQNAGSDTLMLTIVYSIIGVGWWTGIIFLMKQGFGRFASLFFSGFMNIFSCIGTDNILAMLVNLAQALIQMFTAVFKSAIMGWQELIKEVKTMRQLNASLTDKGITICRNTADLKDAILKRLTTLCIESSKKVDSLFEELFDNDPWLYDCVSYSIVNEIKENTMLVKKILKISYDPSLVNKKEDVILVDKPWSIESWLYSTTISTIPNTLQFITKTPNDLKANIEKSINVLPGFIPGVMHYRITIKNNCPTNGWTNAFLHFDLVDQQTISNLMVKAEDQMIRIVDDEFGGKDAQLPTLIKISLVYTYIQKNYQYEVNQEIEYWDLFPSEKDLSNPIVASSCYGIINRRGISPTYAAVFKLFMDFYHIENKLICGTCEMDYHHKTVTIPRVWNIIRIGNRWCHVDSSFGVYNRPENVDLDTRGFMRTDKQMKSQTYKWAETDYPECTTNNYGYSRVDEIIEDHGKEYVTAGVNPQYLSS